MPTVDHSGSPSVAYPRAPAADARLRRPNAAHCSQSIWKQNQPARFNLRRGAHSGGAGCEGSLGSTPTSTAQADRRAMRFGGTNVTAVGFTHPKIQLSVMPSMMSTAWRLTGEPPLLAASNSRRISVSRD